MTSGPMIVGPSGTSFTVKFPWLEWNWWYGIDSRLWSRHSISTWIAVIAKALPGKSNEVYT